MRRVLGDAGTDAADNDVVDTGLGMKSYGRATTAERRGQYAMVLARLGTNLEV